MLNPNASCARFDGLNDNRLSHAPELAADGAAQTLWTVLFSRRMLIILFTIASINTTWQILRAWLPKILQEGRGYSESDTLYFTSAWYLATDIGCLGAGALAVWLGKRRLTVHTSREDGRSTASGTSAFPSATWKRGKGQLLGHFSGAVGPGFKTDDVGRQVEGFGSFTFTQP